MFSHLEEVFGSLEFEDSGVARIASVVHEGEGLRVRLHVHFDAADVPAQMWEFACREMRTYELRYLAIESFEFVSRHTLLVPYTAKWVKLSFVGRPLSASALVGELYEVHREVTEGWFAFDAFLNRQLKTTDLLASGSGILAEGPRLFLEGYAGVLERHGLRMSWVAEREPLEWRDGAWLPERGNLQALVLGDSYIIGRNWTDAHRVNGRVDR